MVLNPTSSVHAFIDPFVIGKIEPLGYGIFPFIHNYLTTHAVVSFVFQKNWPMIAQRPWAKPFPTNFDLQWSIYRSPMFCQGSLHIPIHHWETIVPIFADYSAVSFVVQRWVNLGNRWSYWKPMYPRGKEFCPILVRRWQFETVFRSEVMPFLQMNQ